MTGLPQSPTFQKQLDDAAVALERGWSLPYAWIGSSDLHELEQQSIWGRTWRAIAVESALELPGSRVVCSLGLVPIVVVRGNDGDLRGFVNVCRHRGYPVAGDEACAAQLTCRYHGWVYELDGRLRAAPGANEIDDFDSAGLGLQPVQVACWRGVIFANADPAAASLHEAYPDLEATAVDIGFDLRAYKPYASLEIDIACDWKLLLDNVGECYHCPTMHASTLSTLYEATEFEAATWNGGMRHAHARLAGTAEVHHSIQLFPGTMLLMDPVMGMLSWFYPTGPKSSRFVVRYLAAPGVDADRLEYYVTQWSATLAEDKQILEAQMNGVACGRIDRGRLIASREESVPGAHALILSAYREGVARTAGKI
jgi:choline monooxygenase